MPEAARELLHELRVSQIELEMQNEELLQKQEEMEAASSRYFNFYNFAPVGYLTISGQGLILESNLTASRIFGMERSLLAKQPITSFIACEDQDIYYLFRKRLFETGSPQTCEVRMARADGAQFWASMEASVTRSVEDGEPACSVVMSDITERKLAEIELRQAKEQAEATTKLKDKFVTLVAHDLRSPLASMMGLLRHFAKRKRFSEDEEIKKVFDLEFNSGGRMLAMTAELLKLSRLQTGQITLQPRFFKGYMAVADAIGSLTHNAAQKGIGIVNEVPVNTRLYADQSLFDEVLLNLLSNAIKFCSGGDRITIFTPPGLKNAIAVRDTGKGVGAAAISDLFRHEVATTTPGTAGEIGTGLGLPYCHDIMRAHGGELTVESTPGEGSVFCASLPYVKPVGLIVEDDPIILMVVREYLEKVDIDAIEASDGAQALAVLKDKRPDIIITDIAMSGMDGFELLDRLKQDSATSRIPVIVMTGADGETREKAFRLGADDFVGKPVMLDEFVPRVRKFVG